MYKWWNRHTPKMKNWCSHLSLSHPHIQGHACRDENIHERRPSQYFLKCSEQMEIKIITHFFINPQNVTLHADLSSAWSCMRTDWINRVILTGPLQGCEHAYTETTATHFNTVCTGTPTEYNHWKYKIWTSLTDLSARTGICEHSNRSSGSINAGHAFTELNKLLKKMQYLHNYNLVNVLQGCMFCIVPVR